MNFNFYRIFCIEVFDDFDNSHMTCYSWNCGTTYRRVRTFMEMLLAFVKYGWNTSYRLLGLKGPFATRPVATHCGRWSLSIVLLTYPPRFTHLLSSRDDLMIKLPSHRDISGFVDRLQALTWNMKVEWKKLERAFKNWELLGMIIEQKNISRGQRFDNFICLSSILLQKSTILVLKIADESRFVIIMLNSLVNDQQFAKKINMKFNISSEKLYDIS